MYVLGLSGGFAHDASACLVRDGSVVALAEEERFIRRRHAYRAAPVFSSKFCLDQAGIQIEDVSCIALSWLPRRGTAAGALDPLVVDMQSHEVFRNRRFPRVEHVPHHTSHAAASYYCSDFEDASIIIVDGQGDDGISTTLARGTASGIEVLRQFPLTDSLGHFYSSVTNYLGLGLRAEGKLMGLASYGTPTKQLPILLTDEGYRITLSIDDDGESIPYRYESLLRKWHEWLTREFGAIETALPGSYSMEEVRSSTDPQIRHQADIAASAQVYLESALVHLTRTLVSETGIRKVVLGGGVALNCSANSSISRLNDVDDVYVFPAANDAGGSLGAALEICRQEGASIRNALSHAYLGPEYSSTEIARAVMDVGLVAEERDDVPAFAASLLSQGKVLGWFQGRMEAGPRALGNRSILSAPDSRDIRDRVNTIKGRERWRPLAPSLLIDHVGEYMRELQSSPFMLFADSVRESKRQAAYAIVHVDGTTRPQTVVAQSNPRFFELITAFEQLSGVPLVLNTSFNLAGQPIVCSPHDALRCFAASDLDALVLGNWVITKIEQAL